KACLRNARYKSSARCGALKSPSGVFMLMRKFLPLALMLALLCPCASVFTTLPTAQARVAERRTGKLTKTLRARARRAQSGERARVIVNLAHSADAATTRRSLESAGAHVRQQLDELGVVVADVPT